VRRATIPVVTARFSRILVAYDGSEGAKRSLEAAFELARAFDAEIHALAVEPHLPHYGATVGEVKEELQLEETEAARVLGEARELADRAGIALKTEVVAGHEAHTIVEAAKRDQVDLIVLGHAGRSGVWGLFPGPTAERVSRHAPCSVLIVR
jgi:nucleotide-binding universal stress UspA family protein